MRNPAGEEREREWWYSNNRAGLRSSRTQRFAYIILAPSLYPARQACGLVLPALQRLSCLPTKLHNITDTVLMVLVLKVPENALLNLE